MMYNQPVKSALDYFAPHVAKETDGPIRVRATSKGFHNNRMRSPGDEFGLHSMQEFSDRWMVLIDAPTHPAEQPLEQPPVFPAPETAAAAPAPAASAHTHDKPAKHSGKKHGKTDNDVL